MKKIILLALVIATLSVSLGGCFIAVEDHEGRRHGGGRDHGERHEERRY